MKQLLILLILIAGLGTAYSQNYDLIINNKGDSIACLIDSISDSQIYYQAKVRNAWINTYVDMSNIIEYKRNVIDRASVKFKSGTSIILSRSYYKVDKTKYDYKTWSPGIGDPYNPTLCGVLSFIIPGTGQMRAQEFGRGAAFLGGYLGCYVVSAVGTMVAFGVNETLGGTILVIGLVGAATVDIISVVDAIRVAKVKNLAWRDRMKTGFNLRLEPYIVPLQTHSSTHTQVGLSLKVNF